MGGWVGGWDGWLGGLARGQDTRGLLHAVTWSLALTESDLDRILAEARSYWHFMTADLRGRFWQAFDRQFEPYLRAFMARCPCGVTWDAVAEPMV